MWKVLEDKLEFIRGNAALLVFTKNPETFLFTIFGFHKLVMIYLTLYSFSRSASVFFSTNIWQNSVKFMDLVPLSTLLIISLTSICEGEDSINPAPDT